MLTRTILLSLALALAIFAGFAGLALAHSNGHESRTAASSPAKILAIA
ncbi:MAG TPA: hypothetical protein VIM14_13720 [Polyangia bacterium]